MNIKLIIENEISNIIETYKDSLSLHLNRGGNDNFNFQGKYHSDSIRTMSGRGTGHFGSGTYFSSYKEEQPELYDEYLLMTRKKINKNNPVIQLNNGVYMVDLDYYHLYKPRDRYHAELLFNVLKKINRLVSVHYFGMDVNLNKSLIVEINSDLRKLDLKLPNLNEFLKYLKQLNIEIKDNTKSIGTLSTKFMEYNGYNGVNLNHIKGFDNTLHGTVVYDLTKTIEPFETPRYNKYNEYERESFIKEIITKINRAEGYMFYDLTTLDIKQINLLFNSIDVLINIDNLEFAKNEAKITDEQYDHILKIYPKYFKRIINNNDNVKITMSSIIHLLSKNSEFFDSFNDRFIENITYKITGDSYSVSDTNDKNILKTFLNNLKNRNISDNAKVEIELGLKDLE